MDKLNEVFEKIQAKFRPNEIFQTTDLIDILNISRSMSSNYLNQLVNSGFIHKENTRPVKFWYEQKQDVFQNLIGKNDSLKNAIKQCKAAVNYPPDGIPIILKGNSGVGKSMIAQHIYEYAMNTGVIEKDAPFVTLNCADYANNPELLSSMLFGHVKGAFTGANESKTGLLKMADKGYLFLDEVHNLSEENQEKLFLLIDQKKYRQLGDDENWNFVNVRLVLATTENVEEKLLKTFRRRIPLEVTLPDFIDRTRNERVELVFQFFKSEAKRIDKEIYISPKLFQEIVELDLDGNVGAIQNKIKVYCASSYNESRNSEYITVPFDTNFEKKEMLYITRDSNITSLKELNRKIEYSDELDFDTLKDYFNNQKNLGILFSDYDIIFSLLKSQLRKRNKFGINFSIDDIENISLIICLFIGKNEENKKRLSQTYAKYNQVIDYILDAAQIKDKNNEMINSLLNYLKENKAINSQKNALIVMHGDSIASNMALELNNLIGDYIFDAIDMPMQVDTKEIVKLVNKYVVDRDTRDGLLLLVDMGSLEKMYEEIKDNVSGDLLILNNVSTAVALHLGFSLSQNQSMDYYTSIDYSQFNIRPQYFEGLSQVNNIVVSCMSGEGISRKIKDIFEAQTIEEPLEIITLDFEKLLDLEKNSNINSFKNTCAVISTADINIPGVQCFNLEKIVNGSETLSKLKEIYSETQLNNITNDIIKLFTIEGASERLKFLNPDMVINEIEIIISKLENSFDIKLENFIRINLFLHLSSMIERILIGDVSQDEEGKVYTDDFKGFLRTIDVIFQPIKEKYNIIIPDKEYEYIHTILSLKL